MRALEIGLGGVADALFLGLGQQLFAVAARHRIGRIDHDLAGELRAVFLGEIGDRLVGHRDEDHVAEIERLGDRAGLGERAEAIDQDFSSSGCREENST